MTQVKNISSAQDQFAQIASQMARNPDTLAAFEDAVDEVKRKREIGARIKEMRERRGLSQEQVADRVGAKLRTYQNWEAGGGTSGDNYEHLAEVLGTSFDYLVTGAEAAPPPDDILKRLDQLDEALKALVLGQTEILQGQAELASKLDGLQKSQGHAQRRRANDG